MKDALNIIIFVFGGNFLIALLNGPHPITMTLFVITVIAAILRLMLHD